jgi:hypothetical protein
VPSVKVKHVQEQSDMFDCGVVAVVFVTSIVLGNKPNFVIFDLIFHCKMFLVYIFVVYRVYIREVLTSPSRLLSCGQNIGHKIVLLM